MEPRRGGGRQHRRGGRGEQGDNGQSEQGEQAALQHAWSLPSVGRRPAAVVHVNSSLCVGGRPPANGGLWTEGGADAGRDLMTAPPRSAVSTSCCRAPGRRARWRSP